ncbi:DNA topoisomerase 2 [Massospora cicadina]|nr:DNA topoisomerase 2 [Massospora cicadina]
MQDNERQLIDLALIKKKTDAHKEWLSQFHPGTYIDQSGDSITYTNFINKELIHFSMADNIFSIPSMVDSLKPGQHKDYEKHHSDMGMRYIVQVSEASMAKLEKEDLDAKFKLTDSISTSNLVCFDKSSRIKCYASDEEILTEFYNICLQFYHMRIEDLACSILTFINEELEMCNVTHTDLIKRLIENAFDPINTKDDDGATNSGLKYLLDTKMISMTRELVEKLIRVHNAKFEEIEVLCAKSPLDLYNADLNLLLKLWKEMDKAKLGSPPLDKPLSRSKSNLKPKSKPIYDNSDDSDDQFKGSLSQRNKSMAKVLALNKSESKTKVVPKRKTPKVSDIEEDFEVEAMLHTIAKARPPSPSCSQSQLC